MTRSVGVLLIPLLIAACTPTTAPPALPTPLATAPPTPSPPSTGPAILSVTGSGQLCGQWYLGCGAFLAVEQPGWSLPAGWAPSADDTRFDVKVAVDLPTRVTGVTRLGQDRLEPGAYRLVVILTTSPDDEPEGTSHATFGCSGEMDIAPGTRAVSVDVSFAGGSCTITVAFDAPTSPRPGRIKYEARSW